MSTRATIIIGKIHLYRHSDGYPECCGRQVLALLPPPDEHWDEEEIATRIVRSGNFRDFMCATGEHGDEEYKYVVNCRDRKMHFLEKTGNGWEEYQP